MSGYRMIHEGREVDVDLQRDRLQAGERSYTVRSATIAKKKRNTTFKSIVFLLVIFVLGLLVFAAVNRALGEGDSSPYEQMDKETAIPFRASPTGERAPVHVVAGDSTTTDLEDYLEYDSEGHWESLTIPENGGGKLLVMFYGNAEDLYIRDISELSLGLDSDTRYRINSMDMVILDSEGRVLDSVSVELPEDIGGKYFRGRNNFRLTVDELTMGSAKNLQSGQFSNRKGLLLEVEFVDTPTEEVKFTLEWSPEYYHESSVMQDAIGMSILLVTVISGIGAYFVMSREYPALVVDHEGGEITLFGNEEDVRDLYYRIAKVAIPKMEKEEKAKSGIRPGISKGEDLMEEEKVREISKDLDKVPGSRGRMVVQQCPQCGSDDLYFESGFITGYVYHCRNCDYVGSFVIEKEVNFSGDSKR